MSKNLEEICARAYQTREAAKRLRAERYLLSACPREEEQGRPCWKAKYHLAAYDESMDAPRLVADGYFEHGGGDQSKWCSLCKKRQTVHEALSAACHQRGKAMTALWAYLRNKAKAERGKVP